MTLRRTIKRREKRQRAETRPKHILTAVERHILEMAFKDDLRNVANNLVLVHQLTRDFDQDFTMKPGDVLSVRTPRRFS